MSIALHFPRTRLAIRGHGEGVGGQSRSSPAVFEEADEALGFALSEMCFGGPAEELQLTENTQPAILTASVARCVRWRRKDFPRRILSPGHSLGEYSALVAAGALSFTDAVRTVRARGQLHAGGGARRVWARWRR